MMQTTMPHCAPIPEVWRTGLRSESPPAPAMALLNGLDSWWALAEAAFPSGYQLALYDNGPANRTLSTGNVLFPPPTPTPVGVTVVEFSGYNWLTATGPYSTGSIGSFTWVFNAKFNDKAGTTILFALVQLGAMAVMIFYDQPTDTLRLQFSPAGSGGVDPIVEVPNFTPSLGVWYYLVLAYDADSKQISLSVTNAGSGFDPVWQNAITYTAFGTVSGGFRPIATTFRLGDFLANGYGFKGRFSRTGFWKRLLNVAERNLLSRNNGDPFSFWTPAGENAHAYDVPTAPTGLGASGTGPITLTWTNNYSGNYSTEIWRDDGSGYNFELLATVGAGVSSYEDTTGNILSSYKVRAIGDLTNPSAFASYITPPALSDDGSTGLTDDGSTVLQP